MNSIGFYIHIPYCVQKCAYCDFYSLAGRDPAGYSAALIKQIKSCKKYYNGKFVDSIYIGGGTPSILPPENIKTILEAVRAYADVTPNAEITIEANPGTLDSRKLSSYRAAGINRLSIGLQSADNEELFMLSRIHTLEEFENSFLLARMEGFENINVDIMYALPFQTFAKLSNTLAYVADMKPEHVSFYGLKIEDDTPFGRHPNIKNTLPDEDTQVRMYMNACKVFDACGLDQYEISNFAKKGFECKHNLKYWHNLDYIGFGPGAHSMVGKQMFSYKKDIDLFMQDPTDADALLDENYKMSIAEASTQYVMLAFRLSEGVSVGDYNSRYGLDFEEKYLEKMQPFIERKLIVKTNKGYALTRRGMLVSNMVLATILDFDEI